MKIVVLDGSSLMSDDVSWEGLEALGELTVYRNSSNDTDELVSRIGDAEVVITNKKYITPEVIDACPGVGYICDIATGYDNIDVEHARKKGIPVSNVPAYGTAVVAQFSIALLLEICHHVGAHSDSVHAGRRAPGSDFSYWEYPQTELDSKTMGIIGFGKIGQREAMIAKALGMNVLAYDIRPTESGSAYGRYVDLETLLAESDVISLHCNLTAENTGMINKETISEMKDGVIILNTARGPLINEQDLADALRSGKVAYAGVDVVSEEPIRDDNPLLTAPNCIITPHIAWAARESRQRIMDVTVENIKAYMEGKPVNVVNK